MSEFTRGQEIEAVRPIRLANGITLEVGERGKVIGMGSHDTVSVQFENFIGGVSVWASLIAPVTTPAETGAGDYVHGYLDMMGATPHPDARTRIGELLQRPAKAYSDTLADKEWESAKVRDLESQLTATRARLAAVEADARELRLQVIDLDGWKTEALNRGTLLEQFYSRVQSLFDVWTTGKGALKRNTVALEVSNLLREFRTWQPKKVIGKQASEGEGGE